MEVILMNKFFLLLFLFTCWVASETAHAAYDSQAKIVTTEELWTLLDTAGSPHVVIDARNPEEYQEVHIKGAINIPVSKFQEFQHLLPQDKSVQLIFYCNGVKCGKSKRAAKKAYEEGYTNILLYAEGMPVWEEKGFPVYAGPDYEKPIETAKLSPTELQDLIKKDATGVTVVDVRDAAEYKDGHIPGAVNIASDVFASKAAVLEKDKKIVVYCNSGGRSYNAYHKLMKLGYEHIYQALFFDWKSQGLPVDR
jgi:rhodanese-related sulfurtransferase